ncbi:hypothetical protein DB88DRAFT_29946 [Papiliotrema laurentii]|uniref:Uncharacterized protein n=1 Tax=Papiliotrema laurentii TaxID=5418 RepID=A0AAD9FW76_PAPLA|nr:hypothetical protein DB88DRAFT_29946 [Papiliotrema laurentii]
MPYISTEALVGAGLLVVLAFGFQYVQSSSSSHATSPSTSGAKNKKRNKKKSKAGGEDKSDSTSASSTPAQSLPSAHPAQPAVEKQKLPNAQAAQAPKQPEELSARPSQPAQAVPKRKTLAEKIAPQPRKTKVDDMLAPEDLPAKHARVMRIVDPSAPAPPMPMPSLAAPLPQPPSSSSQSNDKVDKFAEDYDSSEDESQPDKSEDDGWNVVASKPKKLISLSLSASAASAPSSTPLPVSTKIQKKNAKKAEAKKAARAAEEADRQRRLAMHRRDLERERINELYTSHKKKGTLGGSKATAGAMVDAKGKLIWD